MDIAIWGAGKYGQYAIRQLMNNPGVRIRYVIDRRAGELDKMFEIPVVTPTDFASGYAGNTDAILVAFANGINSVRELKEFVTGRFGFISDLVYQYDIALDDDLWERQIIWDKDLCDGRPVMSLLETNVVDHCNLNCKGCSHFSNIYPKGSMVAFEDFKRDIEFLSKKINIIQFNLLGGEVFLCDDLENYIDCLLRYMPMTRIQLVTNGILIPKQTPERMRFLAENNVYISVTEYPPVTQMREKIHEMLDEYGIHFEMRQTVTTFGKNIDISGKNDPWEAQRMCRESKCHFLREGKIYKCPFSALGNHFFEHYDIPMHFEEAIEIYKETNDWETIIDDLDKRPVEQCRFCGMEERFPWAVSVRPEKEEWMI